MVKKILVLMIAVSFAASAMPALVNTARAEEKSVFQNISDTINKPISVAEKDKVRPIKKITVFQYWHDKIEEGAAKARSQSLRGGK